jgi:tRNA (guanine-N7-)-methyltransferase
VIPSLNRGPRRAPPPVPLPPGMAEPLLSLAAQPAPFVWESLFGRLGPVEIEIGTGKGTTLLSLAAADPKADFLGIEVGSKWVRLARSRAIQAGLTNVRLVAGEAQWILDRYLPPGTVRRFHVYFPDPWPKKRHGKRRLFQATFPPLVARALAPGGEVRVATDHAPYHDQILEVMEAGGFRADAAAVWEEGPVSAFERKYRQQGRAIHRLAFRPAG